MVYAEFIASKTVNPIVSGFDCGELSPTLFDFQRAVVKWAIKRGRAAIFGDTGNGKTVMQVEWARRVADHTGGNILIAAPLCVAQQTVEEAADKLGVAVHYCRHGEDSRPGINITNYEMLHHFDLSAFAGIVLDESSIIKHQEGKTRNALIDAVQSVPYRLACTATPSPNDFMELGNHAEFLGIMSMNEMLATYFMHDGGETSKWILKGHAKTRFWEWLATWACVFRNPSDLGFDGSSHVLPELKIHRVIVHSPDADGQLFPAVAEGMSGRQKARKESVDRRVEAAAELANKIDGPVVTWCLLNDEGDKLQESIAGAVQVAGADTVADKETRIMGFSHGEFEKLVSKTSICGFGLNWQHCNHTIFASINDSFEQFYQAVKRFHRFGQKHDVHVHVVYSEAEGPVFENIMRKWAQHEQMQREMVDHMRNAMQKEIFGASIEKAEYVRDVATGEGYEIHLADCCDLAAEIADDSIGFSIYSPPFSQLYCYSNSDRDMGNSKDDAEFMTHYRFMVDQLLRITMPGRLTAFHVMNIPAMKGRDGFIGLKDFRGDLIRLYQEAGWIYHSEVCIWKDPVTQMQRTKALGLLHKTIRTDSSMSRQGLPDYLVVMRKPGDNVVPISHTHETFPVSLWQKYASPVWFDIDPGDTLNFSDARDPDDVKHICPLQLGVIRRALDLWSAPGDTVFSPFSGIGSEGYCALQAGRKFIGSELKPSYWKAAVKNLDSATKVTMALF